MTQSIREKVAKEKYEKDGWKVLHKGAPDFLMFKENGEGKIEDIKIREIKGRSRLDKLSKEQKKWIEVLKSTGLDTGVRNVSRLEIQKYISESSSSKIDKMIDEFNVSISEIKQINMVLKEIGYPQTSTWFSAGLAWIRYKSGKEVPSNLAKFVKASGQVLKNNFNKIAKEKDADIRMSASYAQTYIKETKVRIVPKEVYNKRGARRKKGKNKGKTDNQRGLWKKIKSKLTKD